MCTNESLKDSFITIDSVKAVFNSFGPEKAGGFDEIKPKALQNLPEEMIVRLTTLFRACIALGHTPAIWTKSRVVFIPKVNKSDYSEARAWRPITLSSFLVKSVEKLVLWELEHADLIDIYYLI